MNRFLLPVRCISVGVIAILVSSCASFCPDPEPAYAAPPSYASPPGVVPQYEQAPGQYVPPPQYGPPPGPYGTR
jgi:hypothetical protein